MRELRILSAILRTPAASQRALAKEVLLGSTMVHRYITEFVEAGLVRIDGASHRSQEYRLTSRGIQRRETLLFEATKEVVQFYGVVKQEFQQRLVAHAQQGSRKVVLFGAAGTAELVRAAAQGSGLEVLGVVDSDPEKQGQRLGDLTIQPPSVIAELDPDTVLITSFGHSEEIRRSLHHLESHIRVDVV